MSPGSITMPVVRPEAREVKTASLARTFPCPIGKWLSKKKREKKKRIMAKPRTYFATAGRRKSRKLSSGTGERGEVRCTASAGAGEGASTGEGEGEGTREGESASECVVCQV